ncbi:MAG: peroxidase-related enzyme [SAR202 cluster bacterium]|uniref:Carboxymuconolactone decarboxylase-like domain-containing protein n=1 Tax=hydrothermal vent metagenome TaxID=652676 RepID=A0A160V8C8_9ZZZZ|nr:peroxidase-related enzyme [Dehalococcoidia bacterium]MQG13872.1 peroxidase-related enzyme [SAR202 cluster bacterium]MQG63232.1 peroxidase-related enzyme [SAR202 cluster bacterium]MQG64538.1 peroxidase-related enzyme [SAR202 cluster bacterium]MQG71147.1 peroxidase-related enzyme [SAR202 cluster bacterium]|tara:strand:+ start:2786 stop:3379 length:594 start_codon:yes stop_codon:yes gene_type:complete
MSEPITGEPIKNFTTAVPHWQPRVTPVELQNATDEQLDAMKVTVSNTKIGEYTLVLALDPETLQQRTPLFNGIMYGRGGLSRAETELGAVAASVVNQCIYCAAVHANRYNELTKDESLTERIFAGSVDAETEPRINALLEFATKLSQCPSEATRADVERLIENGLSMGEVLDLVLSASLFGWANRLMHVLGDPLPQG